MNLDMLNMALIKVNRARNFSDARLSIDERQVIVEAASAHLAMTKAIKIAKEKNKPIDLIDWMQHSGEE